MYQVGQIINHWLPRVPHRVPSLSQARYVLFDGTGFEKRRGIFSLMQAPQYQILYSAYGLSEGPRDLFQFCKFVADLGLCPKSATVDGNPHLIRILQTLWPRILIQRCLVHIQRQGLMWCRRNPKRIDAKHLREIFLQVMSIRSFQQRDAFLDQIQDWEGHYGKTIASTPESGWVFSDLKRARNMLLTALPDMFHYLQDTHIPTSTNALEGYFSRLKQRYRQHRGLSKHKRKVYFQWYTYLCPK